MPPKGSPWRALGQGLLAALARPAAIRPPLRLPSGGTPRAASLPKGCFRRLAYGLTQSALLMGSPDLLLLCAHPTYATGEEKETRDGHYLYRTQGIFEKAMPLQVG